MVKVMFNISKLVLLVSLLITAGVQAQDVTATETQEDTIVVEPVATEETTAEDTTKSDEATPVMNDLEAVITEITGKSVQYRLGGEEEWLKAEKDVRIGKDGVVRTGFGSSCEISFRGNTIVQVAAFSSVRIAEYIGNEVQEKVSGNLQYGAVRCGVEKGRIKSDTQISTPVSTLSIRGTITRVEFDPGINKSLMACEQDGPADARNLQGSYRLREGMKTDSRLSRHLKNAIFGRNVFVTGSQVAGGLTPIEAESMSNITGAVDLPGEGGGVVKNEEIFMDTGGEDECPSGECPIGPTE